MAGISNFAQNVSVQKNYRLFNGGSELELLEISNSSGLEWYCTEFRKYDFQIGRFIQIDAASFLSFDKAPYIFSENNPILLNDPLGLSADSTVPKFNLMPEVVVTPANNEQLDTENGQVYKPRSRFWDFWEGKRVWHGHDIFGAKARWEVDHNGYLTGDIAPNRFAFTAPVGFDRLSLKNLKEVFNLKNWIRSRFAIYRATKNGNLYIGKASTKDGRLVLRYNLDEIAKMEARVIAGLDNIPNNAVALGIEQLVIDLNGGVGSSGIANKIPATIKEIYMSEARFWLNKNLPEWETLLKFQ